MAGPTVTLTFAGDTSDLVRATATAGSAMQGFSDETRTSALHTAAAFGLISASAASGALVAGAALAGLPLLIGGLGIWAVHTSDVVKNAFTDMKDQIAPRLAGLAAPLEPVLVGLAQKVKVAFDQIAPALGGMFKSTAPMVDKLGTSLLSLVTGAMPGLQTAFGAAQPVIDAISKGLAQMGPAIGDFFKNLSGGAGGAAGAVGTLFGAVNGLLPVLGSVLGFLANWSSVIVPLAAAIGAVALAIWAANAATAAWETIMLVVNGVTTAWTALQWLLNIALDANPIGIVILAVGALVAAIVLLWNHSDGFRNFFINAWHSITNAVGAAVDWIKGAWDTLVGWFRSGVSALGAIFSNIGNAITAPLSAAFNAIRSLWNSTVGRIGFNIPDWVPGIGGKSFHMPTFHRGGVVPGRPGTEVMAILQAGETVSPVGGNTGGGAMVVTFAGNTDGVFATAFMNLIRTGAIQIQRA